MSHAINRRRILLGSALAAATARGQGGAEIPTAIIGTGNRGSYLLQGVLRQSGVKVAALCDIKPDRLDKAATAAARDNPATYSDWRRILERTDIAAVYVATPPHLHAEMAAAALKAGKHVYCEKPIGVTAAQVRSLLEAARDSRRVFVAGQQRRSSSQLNEAIRRVRQGAIGEILMVKAQRHAPQDINHQGSSADWYFDVTKSGGYLIEQSVHNLDLCNWVIGAHPLRANGFGATMLFKNDPPGRTIFDCGSISYDYPGGIKMSFTQNVFHPGAMPGGGQYVYVFGSRGAIDLFNPVTLFPLEAGGKPSPFVEKREEDPHVHIAAFYHSIRTGAPSPADVRVGAEAALTAILGHQAMVGGKTVEWSSLGAGL